MDDHELVISWSDRLRAIMAEPVEEIKDRLHKRLVSDILEQTKDLPFVDGMVLLNKVYDEVYGDMMDGPLTNSQLDIIREELENTDPIMDKSSSVLKKIGKALLGEVNRLRKEISDFNEALKEACKRGGLEARNRKGDECTLITIALIPENLSDQLPEVDDGF